MDRLVLAEANVLQRQYLLHDQYLKFLKTGTLLMPGLPKQKYAAGFAFSKHRCLLPAPQ